jgi:hypothetical protein
MKFSDDNGRTYASVALAADQLLQLHLRTQALGGLKNFAWRVATGAGKQ